MLVAERAQYRHPGEVRVLLVLLIDDLLLVFLGGDESIRIWDQIRVVVIVEVGRQLWSVKDVESNDIGECSPFLIDRTVTGQVDTLEAWKLVFLVLVDAKRDFLG